MRIFLVFILVGLLSGAGFGWWPQEDRDSREMREALRLKAEAALGIRRMLREHPDLDFHGIVVGRVLDGGEVDFRGLLRAKGRAEAVYGKVSAQCGDALASSGCWALDYLEAGGTQVTLASISNTRTGPSMANQEKLEDPHAQRVTRVKHPTVSKDPSGELPVDAVHYVSRETIQQPEVSPRAQADPAPTHKVARPVINTRSGPGTDNPVLTRLNAGARLSLIETRDGWGNFVILDGKAGGQEVWAALSLLEETTQ